MARFNLSATITPPESAGLPLDGSALAHWLIGQPTTLRRARKSLARRIKRARRAAYAVDRSPLHPLAFEIGTANGSRLRFAVEVWTDPESDLIDRGSGLLSGP